MTVILIFLAGLMAGGFLNQYISHRIAFQPPGLWGSSRKIPVQRLLVEVVNGLAYAGVVLAAGWTWESLLMCLCATVLLAIAVIDERSFQIPPECNLLIGSLGALRLFFHPFYWRDYVLGMCLVSGLLLAVYLLTRGGGIGGGDIKLMAAAGLFLGWRNILLAFSIGSLTGLVIHPIRMKWEGKGKILAFGPYLALGIFIAMLYGEKN